MLLGLCGNQMPDHVTSVDHVARIPHHELRDSICDEVR